MVYDVVYVVTNEYEFADVFETMEEAEWYKQSKGTEAIQRVLDEWGIDDPTEEDIDNANIQAGIDGVCYEIEPVDISGMEEDDVIQLTNGAEVDMEEILKTLKANRNTWIDLIWLEIIDDFFESLEDEYLYAQLKLMQNKSPIQRRLRYMGLFQQGNSVENIDDE